MTRKWITLCLSLMLALGTVPALGQEAVAVTDMTGRQIELDGPVTRVVALSPSDCEIMYALGAEDLLVGRGAYCDYPEEVLDLPVAESGADTNLEQILALEPQVVLMTKMAQTKEQVSALEGLGIHVVISDAQDITGVFEAIELIGALTGKDTEAAALVSEMKDAFHQIADQSENTGKTVYFEVSPLEWGLWTAGTGTFMNELANLCGVTNAFEDVEGWAEISQEQVLERDPDYIVTIAMYYGEGETPVDEIMGRPGWEGLTAVKNGKVFNASGDEMSRPGPRLKDAAKALYGFK